MSKRIETYHDFSGEIKHHARLNLWLPPLRNLKEELGRELKYFTLPGQKAFDVIKWGIEGLIRYDERGYPNVFFCEKSGDNFANAKRILGNTLGLKAKFEDVMENPNNPQYESFWNLFPFDVYNLDFCGTWFEEKYPLSRTFSSIIELVNRHVRKRSSGNFLLLLTIRIDRNRTNKIVICNLKRNLQYNKNNTEFRPYFEKIGIDDIDEYINNHFLNFIMISIPKLIAFKIIPQTMKLSGKITSSQRAYYGRNSFHIGKFVFYIEKGKTSLEMNPPWYTQCITETLSLDNILQISKEKITSETRKDLEELKKEIERIEGYV